MPVYRINDVQFDTESSTLTSGQGQQVIDPKLALLLEHFVTHTNLVFSRDQLLETVWKGAVVNDNTINWSISQLRKALADDSRSPQFIQTLSKKGYRFIASVTLESLAEPRVAVLPQTKKRQIRILVAISFVLFSALILMIWAPWQSDTIQNTKTIISKVTPLTSLPGRERGGEISEDGLLLAFLHSPLDQADFQIYLKTLKENIQLPFNSGDPDDTQKFKSSTRQLVAKPLTFDEYNYHQVIWGADNYHLYAVRQKQALCEIVRISLAVDRQNIIQTRVLHTCAKSAMTRISLSKNAESLFLTDAILTEKRHDLYQYDLVADSLSLIAEASSDGAGFTFLDVNPSSGNVLLLQNKYYRETSFLVLDPAANSQHQLFHIESIYYSAFWSNQPNKIWLNYGYDTILEYDIGLDSSVIILKTAVGWNYDLHPVLNNKAIFAVSDANSADLVYLQGKKVSSVETAFKENMPKFSAKTGAMAYVSDRSGLPQVWLTKSVNSAPVQITDSQSFNEFYDIAWSDDENNLIGVSRNSVGMLNLSNKTFHQLYSSEYKPFYPALSANQRYLAFSVFAAGKWSLQLQLLDDSLASSELISIVEGADKATFINSSRFLFRYYDRSGLWSFDLESNNISLFWPEFPRSSHWEVSVNNIVFRLGNEIKLCQFQPINDCLQNEKHKTLAIVPDGITGAFSYDVTTQRVVMVESKRNETNLKLANIKNNQ